MNHPIRIHGWDLALNHSGLVEMDGEGRVTWFKYVTSKPTQAKAAWGGVHLSIKPKNKTDRHQHMIDRLLWWSHYLLNVIAERNPTHICIEDYALSGKGMVHHIGELGGVARIASVMSGAKLRLHDPVTLKMYVAHNGAAKPEEMEESVYKRWPKTKIWSQLPTEARLDLVVGYALCRVLLDEINLRSGKLRLDTLDPKEIQAFMRVTKSNPVNLLGREFINYEAQQ